MGSTTETRDPCGPGPTPSNKYIVDMLPRGREECEGEVERRDLKRMSTGQQRKRVCGRSRVVDGFS